MPSDDDNPLAWLTELTDEAERRAAAGELDDKTFDALFARGVRAAGRTFEWALEALLLYAPCSWLQEHGYASSPETRRP